MVWERSSALFDQLGRSASKRPPPARFIPSGRCLRRPNEGDNMRGDAGADTVVTQTRAGEA